MPKFQFKFQQMLNINEKLKDQKQIEFGKAVQSLELEKDKLIQLENSLNESVLALKESIQRKVSPRTVHEYNSFINLVKKQIVTQHKNVEQAEAYVEKVRAELAEALMEIKKYEKLKEKDYEQFIEEVKQKDNAFIDEIVTYKYTKKDED